MADHNYTAETIKALDWKEHIRLRPGMYIGKLGDGSSEDDGMYVVLKEVLDNCIDEFVMGYGKQIDAQLTVKGSRCGSRSGKLWRNCSIVRPRSIPPSTTRGIQEVRRT